MIFHASIPANDPKHVAHVLAELWDGFAAPFSPFPDAWMAVAGDDRGSIIEIYPSDKVITPGGGHEESVSYGADTLKRPQYSAFHMAIATKLSADHRALATYEWNEQASVFTAHSVSVLTLRGSQIEEITAFLNPELLKPFALPAPLPA